MSEILHPEPTRLDHILSLGYVIADPDYAPQPSGKHGFAKLERDGQLYFGKYVLNDSVQESRIETDAWWCDTVATLNQRQELTISAPRIADRGSGWYVADWIDGESSMAKKNNPIGLDQLMPRYVETLVQLDGIDPAQLVKPPPGPGDRALADQLTGSLRKWGAPALAAGFLKPGQLAAAGQVINDYQEFLTPRLQYGDFSPWPILVDKQQAWWLIDGENAHTNRPRYFDLAYFYTRIFTYMHGPAEAARLLQDFSEASDQKSEDIYRALLPSMTSRAIGMHFDAVNDLSVNDYRAEAQDLLMRCLSRDPAQLF
jgi:hypothetical protein